MFKGRQKNAFSVSFRGGVCYNYINSVGSIKKGGLSVEGYQFHTALLGGFRKRDVVRYLAEEKRLQEEKLEELRQQVSQLEGQLDEARTDGSADRLLSQELQTERETLLRQQSQLEQQAQENREREEALRQSLETQQAQQAQELSQRDALRAELEAQLAREQEALSRKEAELEELRRAVEAGREENRALTRQLETLRAAPAVSGEDGEYRRLLEELRAERQRAAQLESRLRETAARPETPESVNQLWSLCGKMERTIRQMERMLDGPYRVTCYPAEPACQPAEPEMREGEPLSVAEPNSVSSLLRRVRGR